MAQLNTRIILRNDVLSAWQASTSVLLKGEMAVAYCEDGSVVVKFGDGVNAWKDIKEFGNANVFVSDLAEGQTHEEVISASASDTFLMVGDIAIVRDGDKNTAYVYSGSEWVVMSTTSSVDVSALETKIEELETEMSAVQEIINPSADGEEPLLVRVETLEGQMEVLNGDGEGSILQIARDEAANQINEFATKITDDGVVNSYKELVDYAAEHQGDAAAMASDISSLKELVGEKSVLEQIEEAGHISSNVAEAVFEKAKYEVAFKPTGTAVDYRDKEIRVMIPSGYQFTKQQSGEGSDADVYYIGFRAYAPAGAVSFKEDLAETIADQTIYSFENNEFAGTDQYGRKYSIVWLPVARYDATNDAWTYYGANSSESKYIGWYYSVEWYDDQNVLINSDCVRVNLSNEACHGNIKPFYLAGAATQVSLGGTLLEAIEGVVDIPVGAGLKASEEITIAEDGTLGIGKIDFNKIEQSEDEELILNGGGA